MAVVILLSMVGLGLLGTGISRGSGVALVLGMVLMADAMALYLIYGPAVTFVHTLFGSSG